MSKIARQSIFILIGLLVFALLFAGMVLMDKNKIQVEKNNLASQVQSLEEETKNYLVQIRDLKTAETQYQEEIKKLKVSIDTFGKERGEFEKKIKTLEAASQENEKKLSAAQESSGKIQQRLEEARKERDELVKKLKEKPPTEIVYKEVIKEVIKEVPAAPKEEEKTQEPESTVVTANEPTVDVNIPPGTDEYWASILRQKATLEVEIQKLKNNLSQSSIKIVELSQTNANLQLELDGVKKERDQIDQEAKYKMEIVNSLSLELARFRSNKKYISDRAGQLNDENTALRKQIRELIGTKTSLEKTIVNLRQENDRIERRLAQADGFVGNKIDELQNFGGRSDTDTRKNFEKVNVLGNGIELPPIVVESQQGRDPYNPIIQPAGYQAKVLSVNENNNFVIVSLGESDGIKIGEPLTIYHGADYIARVEVIQVRKDISAADIKEQMKKIQPGDIVR